MLSDDTVWHALKDRKSNYSNFQLLSVVDNLIQMLTQVTVTSHKMLFDNNVC